LGAIGFHDEVNSPAASGPSLGRAGDGHQGSSGANHARRPLPHFAADDIENQIDFADAFQGVVIEVEELLFVKVESRLTGASAPRADDGSDALCCAGMRSSSDSWGHFFHGENIRTDWLSLVICDLSGSICRNFLS
jgi:hypothetical protein